MVTQKCSSFIESKYIFFSFADKPENTQFTNSPNLARFCKTNSTTFNCSSTAKPSAEYSLYRNDKLVQSRSTSGVFDVQLNHKGNNTFKCVPNNTVGTGEEKTIQFFVTGI